MQFLLGFAIPLVLGASPWLNLEAPGPLSPVSFFSSKTELKFAERSAFSRFFNDCLASETEEESENEESSEQDELFGGVYSSSGKANDRLGTEYLKYNTPPSRPGEEERDSGLEKPPRLLSS